MKRFSILYFLCIVFSGCDGIKPDKNIKEDTIHIYPTISYLNIKLDPAGHLPSNPYVLEFKNGNKNIVFCGVNHLTNYADTNNALFTQIENRFFRLKPEIAVNEGGDISRKVYTSKQAAILQNGEIGLTKFLCDSIKIKTVDGDPAFELECKELLEKYTTGEVLAYIVTERLMWGLKAHQPLDSNKIKNEYDAFVQNYIMHEGKVQLTKPEQAFDFYKSHYQQLLAKPFDMDELEPTNPFEPDSKFQEIGRTSKEIRDQYLLKTIDSLLDKKNKIFIVFGGWHLLTCQPGLEELIRRKRK